ncbi:MAG: hypothetical protein A2283_21370 [Lentisphaerae bacterium RIFOXYA12_FULL_48_11]|nr:MAG: hypothetical protein A2283_21370 [Lentisphaerae bacterium RIFOXYA12_FULL_48_11]
MKGKNLLVLIVLAVVLVIVAVNTSDNGSKSKPNVIGNNVFPDLVADDVEKIVITSTEGTTTVARVNDIWSVPDRFNYPADFNKLKDYLLKVSDMKIGQVMKLDEKQKASMKLTPTSATKLEFVGKNNSTIVSLLIGEARMRKPAGDMAEFGGYPDGQYVSPDEGKNVYLVSTALSELPLNSKNWLDQDLLNVMSSDIKEILITGPDRKDTKLVRKKDNAGFELDGISTNEVTVDSKMYSIESALTYMKMDEVADPSLKNDITGLDKPTIFKVTTHKGEFFTIKLGKKKDGTDYRFCKIEASLKQAEKQPEAKDDNEKKKIEEAAKERKELEEKIKGINDKLSKWTYLISSQKADTMTPARDVLFEKKKEEKKESDNKTEADK